MKRLLVLGLLAAGAVAAHGGYYWVIETSVMPIRVAGGRYVLDFKVTWNSFENPTDSFGGKVELLNATGTVVLGRVDATVRAGIGPVVSSTFGSISDVRDAVTQFCPTGNPAKGELDATWTMPGLADGVYVLRFYSTTYFVGDHGGSAVWNETRFVNGSTFGPTGIPTIEWVSAPSIVASGQDYTISAHGHDDLGGLTQVNIWKETTPFVEGDGGNGTDGTSSRQSSDSGPATITYTAQAFTWDGTASPAITHTVFVKAPGSPPTVTLVEPASQTIVAGTALTLSTRATDPDGDIVAHNLDIRAPAGPWNFEGGFATGEPFRGGPVGSAGDSTRTASFTFTETGTYVVRGSADDGTGEVRSPEVSITVVPPPPARHTLSVVAGAGGAAFGGGLFDAGSLATVTASPDATHDFAGWSGDAAGMANPLSLLMDRDRTVQANFTAKLFSLTTSATVGGTVSPGGAYPAGSVVTIEANADATHYFSAWSGDASGSATAIAVILDRAKSILGQFSPKAPQSITFDSPGDQPVGAVVSLAATASSGLPVTLAVLDGPASLSGSRLVVTGPGPVTVSATQSGDAVTLPAGPVTVTFNGIIGGSVKYVPAGRTLFQSRNTPAGTPFVLGNP